MIGHKKKQKKNRHCKREKWILPRAKFRLVMALGSSSSHGRMKLVFRHNRAPDESSDMRAAARNKTRKRKKINK